MASTVATVDVRLAMETYMHPEDASIIALWWVVAILGLSFLVSAVVGA